MKLIDFLHISAPNKSKRLTDSNLYYKSKNEFYTKYLNKYKKTYYQKLYHRCKVKHKTTSKIVLDKNLYFGQDYFEVLEKLGQPSFCYKYWNEQDHIILVYKDLAGSSFITKTYHFYRNRLVLMGYDFANLDPKEQQMCLFSFLEQLNMGHLKELENPFLLEDGANNFLLAHVKRRLKVYLGSPELLLVTR